MSRPSQSSVLSRIRKDRCFNPFGLSPHPKIRNIKSLRKVRREYLLALNKSVTKESLEQRICDMCRQKLPKVHKNTEIKSEAKTDDQHQEVDDIDPIAITDDEVEKPPSPTRPVPYEEDKGTISESMDAINESLILIGTSPIKKAHISQKRYSAKKVKRNVNDVSAEENDGNNVLQILKETFNTTEERETKMRILTIFKDWSFRKIRQHFPAATTHMITVAKQTANEIGILCTPPPKSHPSLEKHIIDSVISFYELDDNSRMMSGKKDFVSVKKNGQRIHVQKRLLLLNLKEIYQLYTEKFPEFKCSFSKFASLRPKHCVALKRKKKNYKQDLKKL